MDSGKEFGRILQFHTIITSIVLELLTNDKNWVFMFEFRVQSRVLHDSLVDFEKMPDFGEWLRFQRPRILEDIIHIFSANKPDVCCASRKLRGIVYGPDNLKDALDWFLA